MPQRLIPRRSQRPPAGNNLTRAAPSTVRLGTAARERINAGILIKRLQDFVKTDPDRPRPGEVRLTRTQAFVALALLRKVLPDLAALEVSGNPDAPLTVQVVRFSDAEALEVDDKPLINLEQWSEAEALEPEET